MPRRAATAAFASLAYLLAPPEPVTAASSGAPASLRALAPPTGPPPPRLSEPPTPPAGLNTFRFSNPSSSGSRSSHASSQSVPTPDDFDLADVALVTTLDGRVHALRRETGQWVWTLHDPSSKGAGWVGEPLVSVGSRSASSVNGSRSGQDVLNVPPAGPGSRTTGDRSKAGSAEADEDEVYAIEPHSDGDIYVFVRSTKNPDGSTSTGTLQKLPLSVSQLVSLSPFTFPGDSSRIFVGKKESRLVGVDLKTGKLVGVFGPHDGWCEWKDGDRSGMKDNGTEECEDRIEGRPEDLLYMGRTGRFVIVTWSARG